MCVACTWSRARQPKGLCSMSGRLEQLLLLYYADFARLSRKLVSQSSNDHSRTRLPEWGMGREALIQSDQQYYGRQEMLWVLQNIQNIRQCSVKYVIRKTSCTYIELFLTNECVKKTHDKYYYFERLIYFILFTLHNT